MIHRPITPEEREDFSISLDQKKRRKIASRIVGWSVGLLFAVLCWIAFSKIFQIVLNYYKLQ
jgi:hypothetical protein